MVEVRHLQRIQGSASGRYAEGHRVPLDQTRKWNIQSNPPITEPDFSEECCPGGTLDESQMHYAAMAHVTQWAKADGLFLGGGTSLPPHISHSQRSHNKHLVHFKGSQDTQLGNPKARRHSMTEVDAIPPQTGRQGCRLIWW